VNKIETDIPSHLLDVSGLAVTDLLEFDDSVFAVSLRQVCGDAGLSEQDIVSPFGSSI
jgi:hypothetical protein